METVHKTLNLDEFLIQDDNSVKEIKNQKVWLKIGTPSDGQVEIKYQLLPGSRPRDFGYSIEVFQGSDIPWVQGVKPAVVFHFKNNNNTGSFIASASGIGISEYVAVLRVDPHSYSSFAYMTTIPKIGGMSENSIINFTDYSISSNTLGVNFETLDGNKPNKFNNYIVVWNSLTPSFDGTGHIHAQHIKTDVSTGSSLMNLTLNRGTAYCIAYASSNRFSSISQYFVITT